MKRFNVGDEVLVIAEGRTKGLVGVVETRLLQNLGHVGLYVLSFDRYDLDNVELFYYPKEIILNTELARSLYT